jgi:hypothetical protein
MKIPLLSTCALVATSLTASAYPEFDPNSHLIVGGQTVYEYDRYGQLLSTTDVPMSMDGGQVRDILILENGRLAVFNGTFAPELNVFDGTWWESYQIDGWSSANNMSYGGIANVGDVVYLTDTNTYGAPEKGVIAFNESSISSEWITESSDYIDITLGADNLLYALRNFYGDVDVFDPLSHELVRSVDLGHFSSSRSVTANPAGDIFMASWNGYVARYDASGVLLETLDIGGGLHDIDINNQGDILVGSWNGEYYLTDESLATYQAFAAPENNVFVAFATPVKFTPPLEPPVLTGSHYRHGRNIITTLNWTTEAEAVDVYFNGELLETFNGVESATYRFFKKITQQFVVCNAGTEDCSEPYVSN